MKRGQVEIQFNWIFILIAGALILALFFAIVNTQKKSSDIKIAGQLGSELEKILSGASAIGGTTKSLDLLKFSIDADCDNLYVGGKQTSIEISHRPVFAPSTITGQSVLLWSQDWNTPFRTTTFLYATSPAVRYVFVKGQSAFSRKVFDDLPDELTKELVDGKSDLNNLNDKGNYKIRIIMFDDSQGPSTITGMNLKNIKTSDSGITLMNARLSTQEAVFYDKKGNNFIVKGTRFFTDQTSLYGAIFSDDPETYGCLMDKALRKLRAVSQIYQKRSQSLAEYYESQASICQGYHFSALPELVGIEDFANSSFSVLTSDQVSNFLSSQTNLAEINTKARLDSCQTVY